MKKKIISIALSVCLMCSFVLTSCGSQTDTNGDSVAVTTETKNPVESLTPAELRVYNSLISCIYDFYNPQTVRILEVRTIYSEYSDVQNISSRDTKCYLKISAENRAGGTVASEYQLGLLSRDEYENDSSYYDMRERYGTYDEFIRMLSDIDFGHISEIDDTTWREKVTVYNSDDIASHINQALSFYWEQMGF